MRQFAIVVALAVSTLMVAAAVTSCVVPADDGTGERGYEKAASAYSEYDAEAADPCSPSPCPEGCACAIARCPGGPSKPECFCPRSDFDDSPPADDPCS